MTQLSVSVLGALKVTLDGETVSSFESAKARALLIYLVVEADCEHTRDALAGLLWPDEPDQTARNNLRQTLASLRQTIGDRGTRSQPLLCVTRESVQLDPDADCCVDAIQFSQHLAHCSEHKHRHSETCSICAAERKQAVALYRGDFLSHFILPDSSPFEEWALLHRERLRRQALEALAYLADYNQSRGDSDKALQFAFRQLELDPWCEPAYRQAMRAHAARGERSAALAQFETCRRILLAEMNADPSPETLALYESIRRNGGESILESKAEKRAHLPSPSTLFFGRRNELAELAHLLTDPSCRLITVVGPGGIGKTRLALAAAEQQRFEFRDGVFFVPLASLNSPSLIVPTISSALHISLGKEEDTQEQLLTFLEEREVLLVLDNFEHLLDAAPLLCPIQDRAPHVTFLVTSRERLALQSEWLFDLHGLEYPALEFTGHAEAHAAVELFIQRARQVQCDFALTADNAPSVVRICQMVEGNPLAIELAAASLRMQSCDNIAAGIESDMQVLATTFRDVPARHRSMRATFEYSWRLLTNAEQHALNELSVFRGGFQEEAAALVARATPDLLSALANKSLLRRDATGRYEFHEWVRQLAGEKLELLERDAARSRHLEWILAFAEQAEPHLVGANQDEWLARLDRENNNLRAALEWALASGVASSAARIIIGVWRYWFVRGSSSEARRWAEQTLERRAALSLFQVGKMLSTAGVFARRQGDYVRARAFYEDSLRLRREQGDKQGIAVSLSNLATLVQNQGDLKQAASLYEEALSVLREIDDERNLAVALQNYGMNMVFQGKFKVGSRILEENLALRKKRGDRWGIGIALSALGDIPYYEGDYNRAEVIYTEAMNIMKEMEEKGGLAEILVSLGNVAAGQGDYERAQALYAESLEMFLKLGERRGIATGLIGIAHLCLRQKQAEKAERLYAAAQALLDEMQTILWPADRKEFESGIAAARMDLGEAAFADAQTKGRAMSMRQAVNLALEKDQ